MKTLFNSIEKQWETIKRYPIVFLFIILTILLILYLGYIHNSLSKGIAYLFAMWLCTLITDAYVLSRSRIADDFIVKKPLSETLIVVAFTLLGILFLCFRYVILDWNTTQGLIKLAILPLLLFTFPIVLAAVLLLKKYKLQQLGFRPSKVILIALPVIIVTGGVAYIVAPAAFTFGAVYHEAGSIGGIFIEGFLMAALPEEFTRLILQTRIGSLFNNKGIGLFLATLLWAFMHIPTFYGQGRNIFEAVMGAIRIVPLGLMWGYMTHRTKNIFPAILAHGLNMWGLQNF